LIDVIVELSESNSYTNIVVIIDRLRKGIIYDSLEDIKAETATK
jgi:hypothetical protein